MGESNFEKQRREKLKRLIDSGKNPYESIFSPIHFLIDIKNKYYDYSANELLKVKEDFKVSGRILIRRNQGKAAFIVVRNRIKFQLYLRKEELSEGDWDNFKNSDVGDVLGVTGNLMKTSTNELTLRIKKLEVVSKALLPLPEKYYGLKNIEERYRKRYLDLIINEKTYGTFLIRSKVIKKIRDFLEKKNFLEFETPILQSSLGGAIAKPFHTHHNSLDMKLKLRIATELHLKRLVVGGYEKVFEIGRIFRNEGLSPKHNPEFTSVEIYEAYGNVKTMMRLTEELLWFLTNEILKTNKFTYGNTEIVISKKILVVEMVDLVKKETGVDFNEVKNFEELQSVIKKYKLKLMEHEKKIGVILNKLFELLCEEKLIQPTFVVGYPIEISPLSKLRKGSTMITDRFELFINGREYANGYSELNNPDDQLRRFKIQEEEKLQGNEEATDLDLDFIESLKYGLVPTGGLGIGIDRIVMLLTDSQSIKDVILFPLNKFKK